MWKGKVSYHRYVSALFKIEEHTQLTKAFILASRGSSIFLQAKAGPVPLWSELDST